MRNLKIISIFLGIASAIVIFTFNKMGLMEGEFLILEAIKKQQTQDSLFQAEKKVLLENIDATIEKIDVELSQLLKNESEMRIQSEVLEKVDDLNFAKRFLMDKKYEVLNAYLRDWAGLKAETDSLLQSQQIAFSLVENS